MISDGIGIEDFRNILFAIIIIFQSNCIPLHLLTERYDLNIEILSALLSTIQ